jgi:hypothetical protein
MGPEPWLAEVVVVLPLGPRLRLYQAAVAKEAAAARCEELEQRG